MSSYNEAALSAHQAHVDRMDDDAEALENRTAQAKAELTTALLLALMKQSTEKEVPLPVNVYGGRVELRFQDAKHALSDVILFHRDETDAMLLHAIANTRCPLFQRLICRWALDYAESRADEMAAVMEAQEQAIKNPPDLPPAQVLELLTAEDFVEAGWSPEQSAELVKCQGVQQ